MRASRGEVVLVDFPFASGKAQKLRPAVVIQNNSLNQRLLTSNTQHTHEPSQVVVDPNTADGKQTGLLKPSAIKCENPATVESQLIRRRIGKLPASLLNQLDSALKAALGIS